MPGKTNQRRTNGHAGPNGRINGNAGPQRANGHGPASEGRGGVPVLGGQAASDDAHGDTVANAKVSSALAGTVRDACAAAAPPLSSGDFPASPGEEAQSRNDLEKVPGGEAPLPATPADFVQEIHRKIDLTEVWHNLLRSKDEKVRQRAVERLTDLLYKGAETSAEEPQRFILDLPRPKRD